MKLAVFSDIHANLEALKTFIEHVSSMGVDRYVCLGDIVGYGADPGECIELIRSFPNLITLQGNHDAAVTWDSSPYQMSKNAREVILWSMEQLDEKDKDYLANLPLTHSFNNLSFSHANPYNPAAWRYVNSKKYARRSFSGCQERLIFVGHTHTPMIFSRKNILQIELIKPEPGQSVRIEKRKRQIINCGSIGQPRTGNPGLNYLIFDTRTQLVTFYNLPYNHKLAGEKIISAGLPMPLAKRLKKGV